MDRRHIYFFYKFHPNLHVFLYAAITNPKHTFGTVAKQLEHLLTCWLFLLKLQNWKPRRDFFCVYKTYSKNTFVKFRGSYGTRTSGRNAGSLAKSRRKGHQRVILLHCAVQVLVVKAVGMKRWSCAFAIHNVDTSPLQTRRQRNARRQWSLKHLSRVGSAYPRWPTYTTPEILHD